MIGIARVVRRCSPPSVLACAALVCASAAAHPAKLGATCPASRVLYSGYKSAASSLPPMPWVRSSNRGAFTGHLFYYNAQNEWWRARDPHLQVQPAPNGIDEASKILWVAERRVSSRVLHLDAREIHTGAVWSTQFPSATAARLFPSFIQLPTSGCWSVRLSSGKLHGTVVFEAIDPTAAAGSGP
jgi:hypothetical protein